MRQPEQGQSGVPVYGLEGIHAQVVSQVGSMAATALAIVVLLGIEEQQTGRYPHKDYSYLDRLARVGLVITAVTNLYFVYLAWRQWQEHPGSKSFWGMFLANLLALGAVFIQLAIAYQSPEQAPQGLAEEDE